MTTNQFKYCSASVFSNILLLVHIKVVLAEAYSISNNMRRTKCPNLPCSCKSLSWSTLFLQVWKFNLEVHNIKKTECFDWPCSCWSKNDSSWGSQHETDYISWSTLIFLSWKMSLLTFKTWRRLNVLTGHVSADKKLCMPKLITKYPDKTCLSWAESCSCWS